MRISYLRLVVALLIVACLDVHAWADVRLHRLFTDNMVLQRDVAVPVWGWATPGEVVKVQFGGDLNLNTIAGKDGRWTVMLPAQGASAVPRDLTVQGRNLIAIKNVLVGDVWLCSGQSNMALPLGACNAPDDLQSADLPQVRAITVPYLASERPREDVEARPPGFQWTVCTPQTAGGYSATVYYFGRRIQKEIGVPVGLLISSVGGTAIEKWMPKEAFYSTSALSDIASAIDRALAEYRKDVAASLSSLEAWTLAAKKALKANRDLPEMPMLPRHPFLPDSKAGGNWVQLYNGMIHPLGRFPIRGALWYQGENNGNEQYPYVVKMKAMIGAWRKLWGRDFPFYYVQLANWQKPSDDPSGGSSGWQYCRMAQLQCLSIPKTGMAVTIDICYAFSMNPEGCNLYNRAGLPASPFRTDEW